MKRLTILLTLAAILLLTVGCKDDGNAYAHDSENNSTESVSMGDNVVDFNDVDGEEHVPSDDSHEISSNDGWTNIY